MDFPPPAHAGMILRRCTMTLEISSFPCARGDEPTSCGMGFPAFAFPRARGDEPYAVGVCDGTINFPRARGDEPTRQIMPCPNICFPPRTRGCSFQGTGSDAASQVSPAHAGMFLQVHVMGGLVKHFPRARGDEPRYFNTKECYLCFSPRTRG